VALDAEQLLFLVGGTDNTFDDDVDEQLGQDLALNVDNVFQAEDCDAFDSDVDEAPLFKPCLWPICRRLILLPMKPDHLTIRIFCLSVQLDHVVDLHADHTSISNMTPYDQYVKDYDVSVVHSTASSVPNDTFMMIYDDMCEPIAPSESHSSRNTSVKNP
nr:retrovirus-related Pol polyprotein from transposon TNT 1-94 [Tanacetum cinerariifolium]